MVLAFNTTFDLYVPPNWLPGVPDFVALNGRLSDRFRTGSQLSQREGDFTLWNALLEVASDCPLRDGWPSGPFQYLFVPDKNGVPYRVRFVELVRPGRGAPFKRAYLERVGLQAVSMEVKTVNGVTDLLNVLTLIVPNGTLTQPAGGQAQLNFLNNPMTTLGDLLYEDNTPKPTRLPGNTTNKARFLTQTGDGVNSAAPQWTDLSTIAGGPAVWLKFSRTYADFSLAGQTQNTILLFNLPAKGQLVNCVLYETQQAAGGAIVQYTVQIIGNSGVLTFTPAVDITGPPSTTSFFVGGGANPLPQFFDFGSTTSIQARAISSGDTLDHAVAGAVDLYLQVCFLP